MKDITGYEGLYAITKDGRVWSYPKKRSSKNGLWIKIQTHTNDRDRLMPRYHNFVGLYKNKERKAFQVHRLVALAFLPNPDNKPEINHIDGDSLNNHISNLEWATRDENLQHAQKHGMINQHTEKAVANRRYWGKMNGGHPNSVKAKRLFTMTEVDCIRKIHEVGKKSCRAIARAYNCSNKTISNICSYKSYIEETQP